MLQIGSGTTTDVTSSRRGTCGRRGTTVNSVSALEQRRQDNIKRNKAMEAKLGLGSNKTKDNNKKKRRRKKKEEEDDEKRMQPKRKCKNVKKI